MCKTTTAEPSPAARPPSEPGLPASGEPRPPAVLCLQGRGGGCGACPPIPPIGKFRACRPWPSSEMQTQLHSLLGWFPPRLHIGITWETFARPLPGSHPQQSDVMGQGQPGRGHVYISQGILPCSGVSRTQCITHICPEAFPRPRPTPGTGTAVSPGPRSQGAS